MYGIQIDLLTILNEEQKAQERLKRINQAYEILRASYRKQHASASRSVAEPPLPPPPPPSQKQSTNFPNRTSTDKKTKKVATLSLNPKDINTEFKGIFTIPNYLALVSMFVPQFILIVMLSFTEKSTNNSELKNSGDALTAIFLFLAYVFAWLCGQGAIAYYSYQKLKNKSTTISEAINESINNFPQFLGATILYWILVVIGIILFIIPGMYLGFSLIFYLQTIIIEKCSVIQSFKRSWQIVKGYRKMIFLNLLMLGGATNQINRMTWSDDVIISIWGQLLNLFIVPCLIAYNTTMYKRIVDFKNKRGDSEAVTK